MTATRESQSARRTGDGAPAWSDLTAFGSKGLPLWAGMLLSAGSTALGTVLDILIWSSPGYLFKALFFVGSLLAVALVRRGSVFGPMVQPPLVLIVVLPLLVVATGSGSGPGGGGLTRSALAIVPPLIGSFPIMAAATAATVVIGLVRMFVTQRAPTEGEPAPNDAATKKRRRPGEQRRKRPPEAGARDRRAAAAGAEEANPRRGGKQPERGGKQPERGGRPASGGGRPQAPERGSGGDRPRPGAAGAPGRGRPEPPARPRPADGRGGEGGRPEPPRRGGPPRPQAPGRPRPPEPPADPGRRRPRPPYPDERYS
ncbi:hypothetical protein IQ251_14405 [Saccharopolyspora sp. HNM0983]|uniref:DUF6542 domain-containing protein n=1 Tax=Saccharopolyspora montiporae TaxID=2781240 RepID=A0A929BCR5_9PSEU|nr:DUF6542 domain-containing protein [Saccharopolyspora sp. HNM0983]MBE9375641.1 hypothetical protein [Saccharopolyspora sp. HNM0983]